MNNWIKNLKVGDEVIVAPGYGEIKRIERVEKINKSSIVVGGVLFGFSGVERSSWGRAMLFECTDEARERVQNERERYYIVNKLRNYNWDDVPIEDLRKIYNILYEKV